MKKYLALMLSVLTLVMLAACGGHQSDSEPPEPAPTPPVEEVQPEPDAETLLTQRIEALLSNMTLTEKAAQLFFLRCPESGAEEMIKDVQPGGVLLFSRDYKDALGAYLSAEAFTGKLEGYQSAAKLPLFIGSDEEGGTVTRASRNANLFSAVLPSPQELFAAGGMEGLASETLDYNRALRAYGVNVNFAPVADVSTDAADFIYARSFGRGAEETADYVSRAVGAINYAGIACVLKHFPGYGNNIDTHTGIARDERAYAQFESADFLPFQAGIDAGAPFVLVSHNIVSCMDASLPASLSPAVHRVLRETLSFTGVVLTDDLDMGAVKAYADGGSIAVLALEAGNDMIVCSDLSQVSCVVEAVQDGTLTESAIDEHCARVLRAKLALGLIAE